jgi:hypothetical protein
MAFSEEMGKSKGECIFQANERSKQMLSKGTEKSKSSICLFHPGSEYCFIVFRASFSIFLHFPIKLHCLPFLKCSHGHEERSTQKFKDQANQANQANQLSGIGNHLPITLKMLS